MYVDHLRRDFYDILRQSARVMLIASHEIDSLCAVRILEFLFSMHDIPYMLLTCEGVTQLKESFMEYRGRINHVVLINCGGSVDLMELFENPPETIFFVLDSHRPTHVLNVYNESKQVRIVSPPMNGGEGLPDFDEIFREDDNISESDSDDSEDDVRPELFEMTLEERETIDEREERQARHVAEYRQTRSGLRQQRAEYAKEIRKWRENRHRLLFEYTQHSFYGNPAALVALETAWTMSINVPDIVWWAIIGLTEFYMLKRMDRADYALLISNMQDHVQKITHETTNTRMILKIKFENDLSLWLYRQWSLYESMLYTPSWSCKFQLWTQRGESKLREYMAEVGLPLEQVRQLFSYMDGYLRRDIKPTLESKAEKFQLTDELYFGTFYAEHGFTFKFSAVDNYLAAVAMLEQPDGIKKNDRFFNAMNCLTNRGKEKMQIGFTHAREMLHTIREQVTRFIDMKMFNVVSPLIYVIVHEGLESKWFGKPSALMMLAQYSLRAIIESSPRKSLQQKPLVLMAPKDRGEYFLACGIPPVNANICINFFGKAFEQVAAQMPEAVTLEYFETCICQVKSTEKEKFMEALIHMLS